jgi:hypothetical protein
MGGNSWQAPYKTGWINRSDWTNVHLGSDTTLNADSNITHNLNAPLSKLLVKLFISTDGTDANSFEVTLYGGTAANYGITVYEVDNNNIRVQTAAAGIIYIDDASAHQIIDTENWYYKVKVWYLG